MQQREGSSVPVFSPLGRGERVHAAHPDHKGPVGEVAEAAVTGEDVQVRVGSAYLEPDGSYLISLNALPVNGQLVFRPSVDDRYGSADRETS